MISDSDRAQAKLERRHSRRASLFERDLVRTAVKQSFVMLKPWVMMSNPVMFGTEVGAVLTSLVFAQDLYSNSSEIFENSQESLSLLKSQYILRNFLAVSSNFSQIGLVLLPIDLKAFSGEFSVFFTIT